jgi:hypothetical protein
MAVAVRAEEEGRAAASGQTTACLRGTGQPGMEQPGPRRPFGSGVRRGGEDTRSLRRTA